VYGDLLKPSALAFLEAHAAFPRARAARAVKVGAAQEQLESFDRVYAAARAIVQTYVVKNAVPETLKTCGVDTDRIGAIEALIALVKAREAEPWARALLDGAFGTRAPAVLEALREGTKAHKARVDASTARMNAFPAAWKSYIEFKNVVRHTYGSKSRQYRWIHIRYVAAEAAPDAPEGNSE